MSARAWLLAVSLLVLAVAGCDPPPLASRMLVNSPRVIAILAEPPEIRPGQLTILSIVTGGTTVEPTFRWYACARAEATTTFVATSTFGVAEPNEGCFPGGADGGVVMLGTGPQVLFTVPVDILSRLEMLARIYGANLSPETLRRIARTSGLTVTIGVEMTHGTTVVRAIKRVVVVDREVLNTNPLAPAFTLRYGGDAGRRVRMAISPDDPERCVAFPDGPVTATHGQLIEIAPEPDEERWLEAYDSYDSAGGITRLTEGAFYSWYTTGGWFSEDRTRIPLRNTVYHAPRADGPVSLWSVVRDGRGGASICRFTIDVAR